MALSDFLTTNLKESILSFYSRLLSKRSVADEDLLYRAIHPVFVKPDGTISSGAFNDEKMSVDLASKTTVSKSWKRFQRTQAGLASFPVSLAKRLKQLVRHDPLPWNHSHTLVLGKKTGSIRKELARNAKWEVAPQ